MGHRAEGYSVTLAGSRCCRLQTRLMMLRFYSQSLPARCPAQTWWRSAWHECGGFLRCRSSRSSGRVWQANGLRCRLLAVPMLGNVSCVTLRRQRLRLFHPVTACISLSSARQSICSHHRAWAWMLSLSNSTPGPLSFPTSSLTSPALSSILTLALPTYILGWSDEIRLRLSAIP